MVGLELRDTLAVAVAVDDRGQLLARAEVETGSDPSAAAVAALDRVAAAAQGGLGVAALSPDSAATHAALESLARRRAGSFPPLPAVDSGTAAAVAEAWTGSARDVRDSVYFAVADHTIAGIVRDRVPSTGATRRAPAIAWLALNPVEREDYRKIGCLEAEVASAGIVRRLVWRIKAGDRSRVQESILLREIVPKRETDVDLAGFHSLQRGADCRHEPLLVEIGAHPRFEVRIASRRHATGRGWWIGRNSKQSGRE